MSGMKLDFSKPSSKLPLRRKIPLVIFASAFVATLAVGLTSYFRAADTISEQAEEKLGALVEVRAVALSDYLNSIRQDLRILAGSDTIRQALVDFSAAWREFGPNVGPELQRLYITDNPHPTGRKENLDRANDLSRYSELHVQYHPWIRSFLRERGYYDIFLFDTEGNLVYTVFKELD